MPAHTVHWFPGVEPIGEAVVAIGVFDGVHIGHQALLQAAIEDADARHAKAVAVTFDRDPDQVVAPNSAAPQLLTLDDKLTSIACTGIDGILVIPFTAEVAALSPQDFIEGILLPALKPLSVHIGSDFRFGSRASGDVATLRAEGATHEFDVIAHELVSVDGEAVTSTRIRGLIGSGNIAQASRLLGAYPSVTGVVHTGRGQGRSLGFPTANVAPVPFSAVPAGGVYAGRAYLDNGSGHVAAISVGIPPTFPAAIDYLEAHLIDFDGNLGNRLIRLDFWERLRDQQRFETIEDLKAAIAHDVARTLEIAAFTATELAEGTCVPAASDASPEEEDGIVDPAALEAAERAAQAYREPEPVEEPDPEDWVEILSDEQLQVRRFHDIEVALVAAGIAHHWHPYAPQDAPMMSIDFFGIKRFSVAVPESDAEAAVRIVQEVDDALAEHW